jgi:signal transduction histidine kinase
MNETIPNAAAGSEILIAEDSATQMLLLDGILAKHGFRVITAANGRIALEKLSAARPSLIISDIQMPEMDGFELCRNIKANPDLKHLPVMLLTSLSSPHDIIRGLECGADNFVVKPYEEQFLIGRIRSLLTNVALEKTAGAKLGIVIEFEGERFVIDASRRQILNLLLSTYETAVKTNRDLVKAHEDLKLAQAQLIEAEKLQSAGRLAAGVAHEVRNPLAILEMGIGFLTDQTTSPDGAAVLDEMREAVKRANEVIVGLMEISTPREMGMSKADLRAVIDRALAVGEKERARAHITTLREFATGLPSSHFDAEKLEQAFVNIFTNAMQAMPQGGTLTVRTRMKKLEAADAAFHAGDRSGARFREGEEVIVAEVCDTGGGIAPENLGKLFEPFFSTKPTGKGMGLGLTVARKIIELHGGRIAVDNRPEGGAIVTMTFKIR